MVKILREVCYYSFSIICNKEFIVVIINMVTLENEIITEKYTGRKTRDYVGRYSSDGFSCNCSWFSSFLFCRHLIFYRVVKGLPIFDKIMFHPSFLSESELNNETFDDIAENDLDSTVVRNTGSPRMESLLDEEQDAERRKPKNTRFNDAYDVAKETAARLSQYNTKRFETILSSYKTFSNFIRDGFPEDLVQFFGTTRSVYSKTFFKEHVCAR